MFNAFIYEGIHLVDLARYWYGKEAEWVAAAGASPAHKPLTHDNIIALTVGFARGGVARVVMDWSSLGHQHWIRARLQGDKAVMKVTWGEPIELQEHKKDAVTLPKWSETCNDMKKLLAHFIECAGSGKTPINNTADQLKTLDIIYAAWESARSHEVVRLPFKI
jgi:predicted dehydrogenase